MLNYLCLLILVTLTERSLAFVPGDRLTASYQTLNGEAKTRWIEMELSHLPRFQKFESVMFLPVFGKEFDPTEDAKIFFTFAGSKLIIPWTALYSSREISNLEKLIVTFVHDEYDVLQVDFKTLYGTNLDIISKASYPVMEIEYRWESVQEDDVSSGVQALFFLSLVLFAVLTYTSCISVSSAGWSKPAPSSFHAVVHHEGLRKKNLD